MRSGFSAGLAVTKWHIEASSWCNARCPLCPRNASGIPLAELTPGHLDPEVFARMCAAVPRAQPLKLVLFNGNHGDPMMHPRIADLVAAASAVAHQVQVTTNGGTGSASTWRRLAEIRNLVVEFSIDGLEDTNHLYRQDVVWSRLMDRVGWYITSGGVAEWKWVEFAHNQHQIDDAARLAAELGFRCFSTENHGRNRGAAFTSDGKYSHSIGDAPQIDHSTAMADHWHRTRLDSTLDQEQIKCTSLREIYVSSSGGVYPCCYTAFAERTHLTNSDPLDQISAVTANNNLHRASVADAVAWFADLEQAWSKPSIADGKPQVCAQTCGVNCGFRHAKAAARVEKDL